MAILGGLVEESPALVVVRRCVGAARQEEIHQVRAAPADGQRERGVAGAVPRIDLRPALE